MAQPKLRLDAEMRERAIAWGQDRGREIPQMGTPEWGKLYQEWVEWSQARSAAVRGAIERRAEEREAYAFT